MVSYGSLIVRVLDINSVIAIAYTLFHRYPEIQKLVYEYILSHNTY